MVERIVIDEEMAVGIQVMAGGWNTGRVPLAGGYVHRNQNRALPLRTYEVIYNHKDMAVVNALQAFIDNQRGAKLAFLVKDWTNYRLTDHAILTATGGEFTAQIKQIWGTSNPFSRTIRYIKDGTLVVKKNGITLSATDSPSDYTVDDEGLITFAVALSPADVITVTCEFYVPVTFEQDFFMVEVAGPNAAYARAPRITLVEELE